MPEPLFHWPTPALLAASAARLLLAWALGALLGHQRERVHSAAGLRTHILVGLGSALFILAGIESGVGEQSIEPGDPGPGRRNRVPGRRHDPQDRRPRRSTA